LYVGEENKEGEKLEHRRSDATEVRQCIAILKIETPLKVKIITLRQVRVTIVVVEKH